MIKQRKRVTTIGILNASNWVRENIQTLTDLELTQAKWCEKLSEGSGESLTISTAIEILEACGVRTGRRSPEETLVSRVMMLEQQVIGLVKAIDSIQKPHPVNGDGELFPRIFDTESEVDCELSRS
jgi:membrane-associated PAP2 superfamily phosphatase